MNLLHDYFYRFPREVLQTPGRCRVRIYRRDNGAHTVLLTELDSNHGESIAAACERIATNLTAVKKLNPKTTRWIQHDPQDDHVPAQVFEELRFAWNDNQQASAPQWQRLDDEQAAALTGASLAALTRRLQDQDAAAEREDDYERTQAKSAA